MRLTIRSGGQAGVDRAALNAALDTNLPYTGWVPKGGRCEDSPHLLDAYPNLKETPSPDYRERTELNVQDSDATIIITPTGTATTPGSRLTANACEQYGKPYRIVRVNAAAITFYRLIRNWQERENVDLNIAGTRESKASGIQRAVRTELMKAILKLKEQGVIEDPGMELYPDVYNPNEPVVKVTVVREGTAMQINRPLNGVYFQDDEEER